MADMTRQVAEIIAKMRHGEGKYVYSEQIARAVINITDAKCLEKVIRSTRLTENRALEAAAKMAENQEGHGRTNEEDVCRNIAAAIRALKISPERDT